jgi:hydrogenase maturation protease
MVAERLTQRLPDIAVAACSGDVLDVCEVWKDADLAVVVDAMVSNEAPGVIRRYDVRDATLPYAAFRRSTHAFGLGDAVALGGAVGALPSRLVVYGVVGSCFDLGQAVSPAVVRVVDELVERILAECDAVGALAASGGDHA